MKLAISVWLWRKRRLLFVFLASLKPFWLQVAFGDLHTFARWSLSNSNSCMAWLLGGLEGVFWPPHHTHCVRKGLGTCVSLDLPSLLHSGWQSPQWLYWCCGQPASSLFVGKDSFSNENGVSLRLCNVQKLVLSCPCFANVNVEKVGFFHRIFGLFGGASEPLYVVDSLGLCVC